MPKTRSRIARLVFLLCAALAVGSASSSTSVADAGPLEGLPVPVREATEVVEGVAKGVAPTVEEVTEAAAPPVTEATEAVTPPVTEVTEAVVPPAKEAVETVTKATQEVTAKVPAPPTTAPPKLPTTQPTDPSSGTKSVTQAVQAVTHQVEGAVGKVTGAAHAGGSSAGANPVGATTGHPARTATATAQAAGAGGSGSTRGAPPPTGARGSSGPAEAGGPAATAKATSARDGLRDDKFVGPSTDGSVRAPLPKWMAYVWPAIALAWPELAGFLDRLERDGARLLLASQIQGGPGGSQGVAGVHASHDAQSAASGSSSSPFAPIPAAVGGFTSHVPGEALAYLAIVAFFVAVVFIAIKFELAHRGGGPS
jgi:hypothetical protein